MPIESLVRPEALDYIAGLSLDPTRMPPQASWAPVPSKARRLEHILGVGFNEKQKRGTCRRNSRRKRCSRGSPANPFPLHSR